MVPPYFTDSLRLTASLSRIHSLSTLTGASRHSLLVPASEYISLTFFLIVRLLILHGSGFRCAALGCIRSLFLRAPLTCRLLSVRVYPPLLLPFIAFAYWLYFLYPAVMLTDLTCFVKQIVQHIYPNTFIQDIHNPVPVPRPVQCASDTVPAALVQMALSAQRNILHEHDTISASGYL